MGQSGPWFKKNYVSFSGKPSPTPHQAVASLPPNPVDVVSSKGPGPAPPGRSPVIPASVEGFHWPDVQELRSKYSDHRSRKGVVGRSRSIPEQASDGGLRRRSSCSSGLSLSDGAAAASPSTSPDIGCEERRKRLHRANSLDPGLSRAHLGNLRKLRDQDSGINDEDYYVAGEAPLPNDPDRKIIVVEKKPVADRKEEDESYVQIRSPTSREKISIMAVIDRCRAYQESDEYKQREEPKTKAAPARPQEDGERPSTNPNPEQKSDGGQQSIVKNLREKFQSLG